MIELSIDQSEMKGTWEDVVPSDEWEHMGEYLLTQDVNKEISGSVDDDNPLYIEDSPFGGPIANPAVLHIIAFIAGNKKSGVVPNPERPSVHAKQASEFLNPARIGKRVKIEGRIPEKYSKPGKDYLVQEIRLTDEDGVPILLYRHTRLFLRRR